MTQKRANRMAIRTHVCRRCQMFTRRFVAFPLIGKVIFVAGALVGRAQQQRPQPDFVIDITAPGGTMTAECRSGCKLQVSRPIGVERYSYTVTEKYTDICPGAEHTACKHALFGVISRGGIAPSN
jgi:hypothetical protein